MPTTVSTRAFRTFLTHKDSLSTEPTPAQAAMCRISYSIKQPIALECFYVTLDQQNPVKALMFLPLLDVYDALRTPGYRSESADTKIERIERDIRITHTPRVTLLGLMAPVEYDGTVNTFDIKPSKMRRLFKRIKRLNPRFHQDATLSCSDEAIQHLLQG